MKRGRAYIIHLNRVAQRRPQVDALMARMPIPASVVEGVDALTLDAGTIAQVYRQGLHRPRYPFELRQTEVACFLSHRKAWQYIVESGDDFGLIAEDDVEVDEILFPRVLDVALQALQPADYVRFPYRRHTDGGAIVAGSEAAGVVEPREVGLGMQMQLVGREAALSLLEATRTFDRPVDTTIQLRWLTRSRILAAWPVCIREVSGMLGGTVVQKKGKTIREILPQEAQRLAYRLKLRILSRVKGRGLS